MSIDISGVVLMSPLDFEMMSLKFHKMSFNLLSASLEHCPFGMLTCQCSSMSAGKITKSFLSFLLGNQFLHKLSISMISV